MGAVITAYNYEWEVEWGREWVKWK
jgi:hypothetical protein